MNDYGADLLREGILSFEDKDQETARSYFERTLEMADDSHVRAQANYYLSQLTNDPVQKRSYLEEALANDIIYPEARRALALLDGRITADQLVNPDTVPAPASDRVEAQTDRFTCPKCGGRMVYSPDGQSLVCESCSRSETLEKKSAGEQDFFAAMATLKGHSKLSAAQVFTCQGCGAVFILPPQALSTFCAYCGSTQVLREQRDLPAPDAVFPMAVDQHLASSQLTSWTSRQHLGLESPPRGFYLPVWSFDLDGTVPWSGWISRNRQRKEVSGEESAGTNNLCVPASNQLAAAVPALLPGVNFSKALAYDPRYLAGWAAEGAQISLAEAALQARQQEIQQIRRSITDQIGPVQDLSYSTAGLQVEAFKLVLLPLWISSVLREKQSLRVIIHGLSGAVYAELPQAGWKGVMNGLQRS